jgi:PTS system mannitol-specific IIC component
MSSDIKIKVQSFGRFLSNMVMPNIGAFIAWGIITALFIPTGWLPNETLAKLVGPMITYLLPLLIGYTGGAGWRRTWRRGWCYHHHGRYRRCRYAMFLGAMIAGPLGGWAIKHFDNWVDGKIKSGFEMLVNNFSAGIIGMILAILAFLGIGPLVEALSKILAAGVNFMVVMTCCRWRLSSLNRRKSCSSTTPSTTVFSHRWVFSSPMRWANPSSS